MTMGATFERMTPEGQEYLEQEYADFEKSYFHGERFWRAPAYKLSGTPIEAIFQQFLDLFPDHPDEYETAFYLVQSTAGNFTILLRCPHFEHSSSADLPALEKFINATAAALTTCANGEIELLDGNAEKLHIRFYSPHEHVVTLLQRCASRRVEATH